MIDISFFLSPSYSSYLFDLKHDKNSLLLKVQSKANPFFVTYCFSNAFFAEKSQDLWKKQC